jgi:hypothetical protein
MLRRHITTHKRNTHPALGLALEQAAAAGELVNGELLSCICTAAHD